MLYVVRVDELLAVTAGERTAAIARQERLPQRRRHDSLLGAHTERRATFILCYHHEARIAGKTLHRLERRVGSARPSMEGCFVDVQDELVAIGRRRGIRARNPALEIRRDDRYQRIGLLALETRRRPLGDAIGNLFLLHCTLDRLHDELTYVERQLDAQTQRAAGRIAPCRQRARLPG